MKASMRTRTAAMLALAILAYSAASPAFTIDTTPDPFSFPSVTNVPLNFAVTSSTVIIGGIDFPAPISVTNGSYSIGCTAAFTAVDATIANGETVCVRHTSSSVPATPVTTTLTIGGVVGTFTSTTIGQPSAPLSVVATKGLLQASVSFGAPASNGGSTITSYTVTASPGGATATGLGPPLVVVGLAAGTSYTFTVRATNTAGQGPASAPSNAVLPFGSPASVTVSSGSPQSANVGVAFGAPLVALVRDSVGQPLDAINVSFQAPASGASAGLSAGSAMTLPNGTAQVTATANTVAGAYGVTASVAGVAVPATFALTNLGASIGLSATQMAFGNKDVGLTFTLPNVILTSNGIAGVTVTSVAATGSGFAQTSNCVATSPVNPGNTCVISVSFHPTQSGYRTGLITITSNAAGSPTTIFLSGTGINLGDPNEDSDNDGIPNGVEPAVSTNPLSKDNDVFNQARLFAMQQYRDFLGREGDAGGINFYITALNTGALSRAQIIENFFNSPEFQGVGAPVARLYFAFFLRIPDYDGLLFQINAFRTGAPLGVIANNFSLSPEFQATYGTLTNAAYVALLYQNVLHRTPGQAEIDYHVNRLALGATRGEVMAGFSESPEYQANTFNDVYVTMMYVGMLRRAPEQGGFDYWTNYMDAGNSGLALILGFLNAPEYHNRFLP